MIQKESHDEKTASTDCLRCFLHIRPPCRADWPGPFRSARTVVTLWIKKGQPVFWLGTTQWELFRGYTLEDAQLILDKSRDKGFVFVQTMLMGVGDGTRPNVYGQKPWLNDNPLTPNEAYFRNVDAVIQAARERDMILYVMLYHQTCRKRITVDNARAWAKWLAQRYKEMPNIVWSLTPEAKPEFVPILRELAAGLREGDGGAHLITVEARSFPLFLQLHPQREAGLISTRCKRGRASS